MIIRTAGRRFDTDVHQFDAISEIAWGGDAYFEVRVVGINAAMHLNYKSMSGARKARNRILQARAEQRIQRFKDERPDELETGGKTIRVYDSMPIEDVGDIAQNRQPAGDNRYQFNTYYYDDYNRPNLRHWGFDYGTKVEAEEGHALVTLMMERQREANEAPRQVEESAPGPMFRYQALQETVSDDPGTYWTDNQEDGNTKALNQMKAVLADVKAAIEFTNRVKALIDDVPWPE